MPDLRAVEADLHVGLPAAGSLVKGLIGFALAVRRLGGLITTRLRGVPVGSRDDQRDLMRVGNLIVGGTGGSGLSRCKSVSLGTGLGVSLRLH